jgi:hypothetical protein
MLEVIGFLKFYSLLYAKPNLATTNSRKPISLSLPLSPPPSLSISGAGDILHLKQQW